MGSLRLLTDTTFGKGNRLTMVEVDETGYTALVCTLSFLILVLTVAFYYKCFSKKSVGHGDKNKEDGQHVVVVFIDAPDPDNPAAVAAIAKHVLTLTQLGIHPHLHVVLTGRPVNLKTEKSGVLSLGELVRQKWETSDPLHAQKIMQDAAARLEGYLTKCNVDVSTVTIYDGGVAPRAPLSDRFHEWDFLFDRKDLYTGSERDRGSIVTHEEYHTLVHKFNCLSEEERERQFLLLLRPYALTPLSILHKEIEEGICDKVILFLGGPATGLVKLFSSDKDGESHMRDKVKCVYGMFGALEPGKGTLLSNQFNVACDIEAACELLISDIFPLAKKYLITTETAKNGSLMISSEDLLGRVTEPYFVHLQKLWESVHNDKPQPMFDIFPVMAFLTRYRECFEWRRQRAVLKEWKKNNGNEEVQQTFCFIDPDDSRPMEGGNLFVSGPQVLRLGKEDVLNFLQKSWA